MIVRKVHWSFSPLLKFRLEFKDVLILMILKFHGMASVFAVAATATEKHLLTAFAFVGRSRLSVSLALFLLNF